MIFRLTFVFLWLCFSAGPGHAQSLEGLTVYRGIDGEYSSLSMQNLETLQQAAGNERITIWVAFNMIYEANPDLRTPEIEYQESQIKQELIDFVIAPLAHAGVAIQLPMSAELLGAPGCKLSIKSEGLALLAASPDVKFIGYLGQ